MIFRMLFNAAGPVGVILLIVGAVMIGSAITNGAAETVARVAVFLIGSLLMFLGLVLNGKGKS